MDRGVPGVRPLTRDLFFSRVAKFAGGRPLPACPAGEAVRWLTGWLGLHPTPAGSSGRWRSSRAASRRTASPAGRAGRGRREGQGVPR